MNKETGAGANPDGSRVGADLVEAFGEMAAYLRGEVEAESYEVVGPELPTSERVEVSRRKVTRPAEEL